MRIFVTGVSGRVGKIVVEDLLAAGHEVRGFDKNPPHPDIRGRIEMVYDELTDRLATLRAMGGCEAIIHLAALPNPERGNEDTITNVNVCGTQYVLAAAEAHDIKRVVLASSCCAFGFVFARHPWDPEYLPIDEKHPNRPQDLYGLSKILNEETAAAYTRRTGMTTICLRLTGLMRLGNEHPWWIRRLLWGHSWKSLDFWTYVEERDMARAFRLAVEKPDIEGHHVLIIAARDTDTPKDIREVVAEYLPQFSEQVKDFEPHQSLYDTSRAEEVLGWVGDNSWRKTEQGQSVIKEFKQKQAEGVTSPFKV